MAKDTKKSSGTPAPEKVSRSRQFLETYRITKKTDRWIGLWVLVAFLLAGTAGLLVFLVLPGEGILEWVLATLGGLMFGLLAALIVFGRRAQKAAYAQMEGQPGAAAAALRMLRRGWKSEPMVAFNKQQDVVHRVVGPPGIVLIGEGNPNRLRQLMSNERRRHERVIAEVPIHEVVCGNGDGQVPLPRLVKHVTKDRKSTRLNSSHANISYAVFCLKKR